MLTSNNFKKIVLIGEAGVGKTTFIKRIMGDPNPNVYNPTLGIEIHTIEHAGIAFEIWDCAGDMRHSRLAKDYWHKADGIIVIIDKNFQENPSIGTIKTGIKSMVAEIKKAIGRVKILIVFNKKNNIRPSFDAPIYSNISPYIFKGINCRLSSEEELKSLLNYFI